MKRRWLAALVLVAGPAAVASCGSDHHPGSLGGDFDAQPNGSGIDSCTVPDTGCACTIEGALVECGAWAGKDPNSVPSCAKGFRRCLGGSWGACETLTDATPTPSTLHTAAPPASKGACSSAPCDPNCVADFTDGSLDGGITAEAGPGGFGKRPNGPPPKSVNDSLAAAGITDPGFYHELDPGDSATDPVSLTAVLNPVDIYFLLNSTKAMQPIIGNLAAAMGTIVGKVQAKIPNVAFGDGRFSNYLSWPYASQQYGNTVYENRVDLNTDASKTVNDVNFINANASTLLVDTPYVQAQAAIPALYAMATGEELNGWFDFSPVNNPDWWWNVFAYYGSDSRASLNSPPFVVKAPACPAGGVGYPCFRPGAYHIVMLMMDFPSMDGPGGSFPYYQFKPRYFPPTSSADYTTSNEWYWWQSKSLGAASPNLPTDYAGSTAASLAKPATAAQVYIGNVMGKASSYSLDSTQATGPGGVKYPYAPSAQMKCVYAASAGSGPDVTYDFTQVAGAPTRFWFDTAGSSYDTILYLINTDTNQIVACGDDELPWLSAQNITGSGVSTTISGIGKSNSAIVGDLPPGHYRLVVDAYNATFPNDATMANRGSYQLNMWPNIDDPRFGGNPHGKDVSTPSYTQAMNALHAPGMNAYVIGLEASGYDCGQAPTSWERAYTKWSLAHIAEDTGALAGGAPVVISVKQDGSPGPAGSGATASCPTSTSFGDLVAGEIAQMTDNIAKPVDVVATDFDDANDFDGVTGVSAGPTVFTPFNVDDATFVASIVANPAAGCTVATGGASYSTCNPGSTPSFNINFAVPPTVPKRSNAQVFHFRLDERSGGAVIASKKVTIVVPPYAYSPLDYTRDFDGSSCPSGYQVGWANYHWSSTDGLDSNIKFYATVATSASGLDAATEYPAPFAIAKQNPGPDTQTGSVDLGAFLKAQTPDGSKKPFVRVRAHLSPSTDTSVAPVLTSWYLEMRCTPNE